MGKKANRKCIICQSEYYYCPNCREDSSKPTWYFIFDCESCHDIYEICTAYRDGSIDKKVASNKLAKCDLSNLKDFNETTKEQINEIMSVQKEVKDIKDVKVETNVAKPVASKIKK